jgi:hypothetical protein
MNNRAWLRLSAKTVHDIASIGFGGALASRLVINLTTNPVALGEFLATRQVSAAIAKYVLIPAMALIMLIGLIAMLATRVAKSGISPRKVVRNSDELIRKKWRPTIILSLLSLKRSRPVPLERPCDLIHHRKRDDALAQAVNRAPLLSMIWFAICT